MEIWILENELNDGSAMYDPNLVSWQHEKMNMSGQLTIKIDGKKT